MNISTKYSANHVVLWYEVQCIVSETSASEPATTWYRPKVKTQISDIMFPRKNLLDL
jgi:hypothetical protein